MRLNLSNNASTVLQSDISGNDTNITVDSTEALPEVPFPLTLNMTEEIVYVTAVDGNKLTVERGREGTESKAYPSGTECWVNFTVGAYDGLSDSIDEVGEELTSHMAEIATETDLGHVMVDGDSIKITSTGMISSEGGFNEKTQNIAIGEGAQAPYEDFIAIGYNAEADGLSFNSNITALGARTVASHNGTAVGAGASARPQAVALGADATAEVNSVAIGHNVNAQNKNEGILGSGGTGSFGTNRWRVPGAFTVNGTKNFEIPHPKPEKKATHVIRHGAVESPTTGDTLYRFTVKSTQENDMQHIDLPDYFIYLNKDVQIFVAPQGHFGNGYGILNEETEQLEIHCQYEGEYNVLVIGTRNDDHHSVKDWDIKDVEREIGESWTGETYAFSVDEIMELEEIKEELA